MTTATDKQIPFLLREKGSETERKLTHGSAWTPAVIAERKDGWGRRKG